MQHPSPFWKRSGFWTAVSATLTAGAAFAQNQTPEGLEAFLTVVSGAWIAFFTAKTVRKSMSVDE